MFSQSLERDSILKQLEAKDAEPKVLAFTDIQDYLRSVDFSQEEIDQIIVEVSHTLPMLEIARKNLGNDQEVSIEDVHVEIDIPNRRVTRVIDKKREEE